MFSHAKFRLLRGSTGLLYRKILVNWRPESRFATRIRNQQMNLALSNIALKQQLHQFKGLMQPHVRRVLVIASDGCTATAAVVSAIDGTQLAIEALATSRALGFERIAEELIAALKVQDINIPKQTILLCPHMLPAVLDLPVSVSKPLDAGQMPEMIRWELEPLFAQLSTLWSIGNLLRGRGYLSNAQWQELVVEHRSTLADAPRGGRLAAARFGELAIRKAFASREQVEECLALQEALQAADAEVLVAWHPVAVGVGRDQGQSTWLCAGINPAIRTRWVDALERQGQHVSWLYPLAAASAPLAAMTGVSLSLELHALSGNCYRLKDGALTALHYRQFTQAAPADDEVLNLLQPFLEAGDRQMAVYSGQEWQIPLAETPKEQLPQEIVTISGHEALSLPATVNVSDTVLAALAGAGAHALGVAPSAAAVRLAGSKPPPSVYLRPEVWMAAAAVLLFLAIGIFELNSYLQQRTLMEQHQELTRQLSEFEARKKLIESTLQTEAELKKQLVTAKAELEASNLRLVFFERAFGQRRQFMETVVDALSDLISDELLLENVTETGWQQLEIQGFALNTEAAYRYAKSLARETGHFGIKLGELDTGEAQGPFGLMGYRFKFSLLKADQADIL